MLKSSDSQQLIAYIHEWELSAYTATQELKKGLKKLSFEDETHQPLINAILISIIGAENALQLSSEHDKRKVFSKEILHVQNALNDLVYHYKIPIPDFEVYIFDARNVFNHLMCLSYKAILTNSPLELEMLDFQALLKMTKSIILPTFTQHTTNLRNNIIIRAPFESNKNHHGHHSVLEEQMGRANFELSFKDNIIDSPESAVHWLNRQVYRLVFDNFFTHAYQIYNIIEKINSLAHNENNPNAIERRRNELTSSLKAEIIITPSVKNYLDQISHALGYSNIELLYKNYLMLKDQDGFEFYISKKLQFIDNEFSLAKIKKTVTDEYYRLKNLPDQAESETYINIIRSLCQDYLQGIDACQNIQKLVFPFSKVYFLNSLKLNNMGRHESKKYHKKIDTFLKNLLQDKFLFSISKECHIDERRIQDITQPLNDEWLDLRKSQTQSERESYHAILKQIEVSPEEVISQNYVAREAAYYEAFNAYKKIVNLNPEKDAPHEKEHLNSLTKEYKIYKNAVLYNIIKNALDDEKIEHYIEKQRQNIALANRKIEEIRKKIISKSNDLVKFESKEKSFSSILLSCRDAFLKLFRFKTASYREKERYLNELMKSLLSFKRECDFVQKEFAFYHIAKKISEEQLTSYQLIHELSIADLLNEICQRLFEHIESHDRIIELYEQSDFDQDISETLHTLEIDLLRTRKIAEFTLKQFLNKKYNNATDFDYFAKDNILILENTYKKIKDYKTKIVYFEEDEKEIILKNLIDKALSEIKHTMKESFLLQEKCKIKEYKSQLLQLVSKLNPKNLNDPFEIAIQTIINHDINAAPNIKNEIFTELSLIYEDFLEKNKAQFERSDLENLELLLRKSFHYRSQKQSSHTQAQAYDTVINKVNALIDQKYKEITTDSLSEFRDHLQSLDGNFIKLYMEQLNARKEKKKIFDTFHEWLLKPYSYLPSKSILLDADVNEISHVESLSLFLKRYIDILDYYIENTVEIWETADPNILTAHRARLQKEYTVIHQGLIEPEDCKSPLIISVINAQNNILEFLEKLEIMHPENIINASEAIHHTLLKKTNEIKNINTKIELSILIENAFPDNLYLKFTMLLQGIKDDISRLAHSIKSLDLICRKYLDNKSWFIHKRNLENAVEFANLVVDKLDEYDLPAYNFYSQINLHATEDVSFSDPKYYGKGLLLSIKLKDFPLSLKLLESYGSLIPLPYLSNALRLSILSENDALFSKILHARHEIAFNNSDLLDAVKLSIIHKKPYFTKEILLNTHLELDQETAEILLNSEMNNQTFLKPINRSIVKLFSDEDEPFLEGIRQSYSLEYVLLQSLESEYNTLKSQSHPDEGHITLFYNKIEHISLLSKRLLHFYVDFHIYKDIARKDKFMTEWATQVNDLKSRYLKGLPNTNSGSFNLKDLLHIRDELINTIDNAEHPNEVFLYLQNLKTHFKNKNNTKFYKVLSEILNHSVTHDKVEALDFLLAYVEEPYLKRELSYNAFCQSLISCQPNCFKYLLHKDAYEFDNTDALIQTYRLYNVSKNEGKYTEAKSRPFISLSLCTIPFQFDQIVVDLVDYAASEEESALQPLSQSLLATRMIDSDLEILSQIKKIYLFCEQAYSNIYDIHEDLRNPFDNLLISSNNDLSTIDKSILREYAEKGIHCAAFAAHQTLILKSLKDNYIKFFLDNYAIKNTQQFRSQLAIWDDNLDVIAAKNRAIFDSDLEYVNQTLNQPL